MHFDTSIDLGTLLAAAGLLLNQLVMHRKNVERLVRMELKVDTLWSRSGIDEGNGHA